MVLQARPTIVPEHTSGTQPVSSRTGPAAAERQQVVGAHLSNLLLLACGHYAAGPVRRLGTQMRGYCHICGKEQNVKQGAKVLVPTLRRAPPGVQLAKELLEESRRLNTGAPPSPFGSRVRRPRK